MIGHYLMFNGNCEEALGFYVKAFDAKIIEKRTYGDMPPNPAFLIAEEDKGLVLHAKILIGGMEIMCADASERSTSGDNMYLSVTTADESFVRKAFGALAEGGKIYMELQPSFFAAVHGSLQDKFGVNWMFTALK